MKDAIPALEKKGAGFQEGINGCTLEIRFAKNSDDKAMM